MLITIFLTFNVATDIYCKQSLFRTITFNCFNPPFHSLSDFDLLAANMSKYQPLKLNLHEILKHSKSRASKFCISPDI